MSRQATEWVWSYPSKDATERLILLSMAHVADIYGWGIYQSIQTIAEDGLCSQRTVQRHLRTLLDGGILAIQSPATNRRPMTFRIAAMDADGLYNPGNWGDNLSGPRGDRLSGQGPARGDTGVTNGTSSPLIGTRSKPSRSQVTDPTDKSHPDYGFVRFWDAYPKRDGKKLHKNVAVALWRKMSYEDKAAAFRGAKNYAASCGNFGMNPDRFLRDEEWPEFQTPAVPEPTHSRNGNRPLSDQERNEQMFSRFEQANAHVG